MQITSGYGWNWMNHASSLAACLDEILIFPDGFLFHARSRRFPLVMRQIYEFGDFRADPAEQLLLRQGQPVALPPKVFDTLLILLNSDGRLIDKNDFMGQLWPEVFVEDVALAQNISQLRKALRDGKNGSPDDPDRTQAGSRLWFTVNESDD